MRNITFLTRHYPPNPNINGESVWDMARYLQEKYDIQSNIICIDRDSDGGANNREPLGNVIRLKTIYQGKNAFFRFMAMAYDGIRMALKARKFRDTVIVCTTSPPMMPFWASIFLSKKYDWGLWALDLFPEGFMVNGKIKKTNFIYKWVVKKTYTKKIRFLIALGQEQAKFLALKINRDTLSSYILPCGIPFHKQDKGDTPSWWDGDKIIVGYCGNIGEAHNPDFIKSVINNIDPEKHLLVLALYGIHAESLKAYIASLPTTKGIILVDRVPRNQLGYIDLHLVSLRQEWTHIAVPSKAVSAIASGACLLFCGSESSDNWSMFKSAGWLVKEDEDIDEQVKTLLSTQITKADLTAKKENTAPLLNDLQNYVLNAYDSLANYSQQIGNEKDN